MIAETSQLSMSTSKSPTLRTDALFTSKDFNISQSTTVLSTDVKSNISQSTTLSNEVTSNEENNINQSKTLRTEVSSIKQNLNISQITKTTAFSSEKDLNIQLSKHLITYAWYLLRNNASCI